MADPFLGEIRIFGGNFAPKGWATCDGQVLSIAQNTALFSLLGTNYGGDGRTTFALPNFQGSAPMHWGQGVGLTNRDLGETGGAQAATLTTTTMPAHSHTVGCDTGNASQASPIGGMWAKGGTRRSAVNSYSTNTPTAAMSPQALAAAGGGQPHNNMQPYLCLTFIIALTGIFPPRS